MLKVAEMEAILQAHNTQVPAREVLVSLAEKFRYVLLYLPITYLVICYLTRKMSRLDCNLTAFDFSASAERSGKVVVQMKQVRDCRYK